MKLLAIDTSAHLCAACVYDTVGGVLAEETRDIGRGHAEILMELIENCVTASKSGYEKLNRIVVTTGPGSFTGVRVGMAAARGLGLSLDIPVAGLSTLDACEYMARQEGYEGSVATLIDARRDEVYCKLSGDGNTGFLTTYEAAAEKLPDNSISLCGSGAEIFNQKSGLSLAIIHKASAVPIMMVAVMGSNLEEPENSPEPLYLRSPDAKPQSGFALPRAEA